MSGEPESQRYFFNQLSMLIDGMKGLNNQIGRQVEAVGRYDKEFAKIRIEIGGMKSELGQIKIDLNQFRARVDLQMEAILRRLDLQDSVMHDSVDHIRELRSDSLRQYNEVINAVQDSYQNRMSVNDIEERLAELERLIGPRLPPAA
ncbi:hypothetical protein J5277_00925 [Rhizobium sp. 16-449-1b]|uniref:hypothetical protein n=1 Tax=Rhizobium sp. 16-449-1b TaxID=2819989 RepID=UPI001ADCD763|nr:hypothetical protein [Rhizobium sp. 16-449-1b]MBO9192658.1 hypothetical protein [Rhizobium sp. 16-449-1b]